jgi:hypothetical protein
MNVGPARTFLTIMLATASVAGSFAQSAKLSSESQAMIKNKLQQSSNNDLLVFDRNGAVQATFKLSTSELQKYKSLGDFIKSSDSPIANCKNPVPTPPPGCVMCDSGHPVCTKAIQGASQKQPLQQLPSATDQRQ